MWGFDLTLSGRGTVLLGGQQTQAPAPIESGANIDGRQRVGRAATTGKSSKQTDAYGHRGAATPDRSAQATTAASGRRVGAPTPTALTTAAAAERTAVAPTEFGRASQRAAASAERRCVSAQATGPHVQRPSRDAGTSASSCAASSCARAPADPPPPPPPRTKPKLKPAGDPGESTGILALAQLAPKPVAAEASRPAASASTAGGISPKDLLTTDVRLGQHLVPAWAPIGLLTFGTALFATVLVALIAGRAQPPRPKPSASAAVSSTPAPRTPPSASVAATSSAPKPVAAPTTSAPGAAELAELEKTPLKSRSIATNLRIAHARAAKKVTELRELEKRVAAKPALETDRATLAQLVKATKDRDTAVVALQLLAKMKSAESADAIYQTWVGTRGRNETTILAEALVMSDAVRARASEALKVALDLRDTAECPAMEKVVTRAIEHGDSRSLLLLGRLTRKTRCNDGDDDCYACLHGSKDLKKAISSVRSRPRPRF